MSERGDERARNGLRYEVDAHERRLRHIEEHGSRSAAELRRDFVALERLLAENLRELREDVADCRRGQVDGVRQLREDLQRVDAAWSERIYGKDGKGGLSGDVKDVRESQAWGLRILLGIPATLIGSVGFYYLTTL